MILKNSKRNSNSIEKRVELMEDVSRSKEVVGGCCCCCDIAVVVVDGDGDSDDL
jgi:hypothetical protein